MLRRQVSIYTDPLCTDPAPPSGERPDEEVIRRVCNRMCVIEPAVPQCWEVVPPDVLSDMTMAIWRLGEFQVVLKVLDGRPVEWEVRNQQTGGHQVLDELDAVPLEEVAASLARVFQRIRDLPAPPAPLVEVVIDQQRFSIPSGTYVVAQLVSLAGLPVGSSLYRKVPADKFSYHARVIDKVTLGHLRPDQEFTSSLLIESVY